MAVTSVKQFASELAKSPETLLDQLNAAGLKKSSTEDSLTDSDKAKLLEYLKDLHGTGGDRKKITLHRKETSEIKQADATGKARTIQVEVRKKRVFVQRDETPSAAAPAVAAEPVISAEEIEKREEDARRQAELLARQAEEMAALQAAEREARARAEAAAAEAESVKLAAQQAEPEVEAKPAPAAESAEAAAPTC
jgi:translation initiation factor IF-2